MLKYIYRYKAEMVWFLNPIAKPLYKNKLISFLEGLRQTLNGKA